MLCVCLWYVLIDFHQNFVFSAAWDKCGPTGFWGWLKRLRAQCYDVYVALLSSKCVSGYLRFESGPLPGFYRGV